MPFSIQKPVRGCVVASWPPPAERVLLGKSIKRLDGPLKSRGAAKYSYDIIRPNMLYGRLLGSPHPHARVRSIDLSAAQKLPGVRAVLALKDTANPDAAKVFYPGEEVAAVAATTEEIAAAFWSLERFWRCRSARTSAAL
jgi:xanthine dehydrogenase YagR molybdenum-binding subunit